MADSKILNEKDKEVVNATSIDGANAQLTEGKEASNDNSKETVENKGAENTETQVKADTVAPTESANVTANIQEAQIINDPRNDDMGLKFLEKDFVYDCMSVPTHSKKEFRMVTFIILWARRNNIKYEFDEYGNIYLTKGELREGEFYPCITSHLDTVQDKHDPYIYVGIPLDLKTERENDGTHKISVDSNGGGSIGIGADDKGGVCISLSIFKHVEKLKACFFLDEETGCNGSQHLDLDWFKDVGYVIGYDSPDLYRAAYSCSGTELFNADFFTTYIQDICAEWGLTKECFNAEPFTDVKHIREKTDIICMNFGNGGYHAHSPNEYSIIEHMDHACGMGIDIILSLGNTEHKFKHLTPTTVVKQSFKRHTNGTYERIVTDEKEKLAKLFSTSRSSYGYTTYGGTTYSTTKKEDDVKYETVKYIVNRFDYHISTLKTDVIEAVKKQCKAMNIESAAFEKAIIDTFSNEIKF